MTGHSDDDDDSKYDDSLIDTCVDADGNPLSALSPETRAWFNGWMATCEAAWKETGDPFAVGEAMSVARCFRQPAPKWLVDSVWSLLAVQRGQAHARRCLVSLKLHYPRYLAVLEAKQSGLSWPDAYAHAAKKLKKDKLSAGSSETMKESYGVIKKLADRGALGAHFHNPRVPNHLRRRWFKADE